MQTSIILKKDEKAFFLEEKVPLKEVRMVSKRSGGGMGVRLFKGVYVGGFQGESRSLPELRDIDSGVLILTNKRLVFDGMIENKSLDLDKMLSIEIYTDGLEISFEGKTKSSFFMVKNPYLWKLVLGVVKGVPDPEKIKKGGLNIKFE